ncbi:hypothetical protein F4678DRAFT_460814 [Xylaria arbuscula]|nr:hypothetical protein F4678DRAFT_460814 [Xylaria arbuscula]
MENSETEKLKASFASYYPTQHLPQSQPPSAYQLPSDSQLLAAGQSLPARQYTTVGSVYNPQPQPLQPPVRRGRTVKSLFPYKSDSPAGPSQIQYTPLQQNSDRAVSPARLEPDPLPSNASIIRQGKQVLPNFGMAVPNVHQPLSMLGSLPSLNPDSVDAARYIGHRVASSTDAFVDHSAADNSTMFAVTNAGSDNGSDTADTKSMSAMNFNSLTNLASYPNPNQRAAQKLLASHRPNRTPAPGSQVSDSQSNPYNFESETLMPSSETPICEAALSRACGAPAPLTAGPPGVRQLRPATFEQETLQRPREFDDENPMMNPYKMYAPLGQHFGDPSFEGESLSSAPVMEPTEEECDEDEDDDNDFYRSKKTDWVVDTLSAYDAAIFYPTGLPSNFNPHTEPISPQWVSERLEKLDREAELHSGRSRDVLQAERRLHVNNDFYSGVNTFNKTLDQVVLEHKRRSLDHIVGREFQAPQNNEGKVIHRPFRVRDVSSTPTSNLAEPLLSMAFQTLINRPEISPYIKLPRFEQSLFPPYLRK